MSNIRIVGRVAAVIAPSSRRDGELDDRARYRLGAAESVR